MSRRSVGGRALVQVGSKTATHRLQLRPADRPVCEIGPAKEPAGEGKRDALLPLVDAEPVREVLRETAHVLDVERRPRAVR